MRAILFTEELMGVALKFSKKSSSMGSLWVSWEPAAAIPSTCAAESQSPSKINRVAKAPALRTRIQAGISLCLATLVFTIFVFFLVCSLDSSFAIKNFNHPSPPPPPLSTAASSISQPRSRAVTQGMGTIFRRGTRSMSEMVIAHVAEDVSSDELRLFLRILHRSGLGSVADVVLLFPGDPRALGFAAVVEDELRIFHRLLAASGCLDSGSTSASNRSELGPSCGSSSSSAALLVSNCSLSRLNLGAFHRQSALAKIARNSSSDEEIAPRGRSPPPPLGSVMGFDVAELDPLDTLSGFLDAPPIQLRRWLCYQMLLGMARQQRRRYRHVVIAQVRGVFLLGDSLLTIARRHRDSSRALVLVTEDKTWLQDADRASRSVIAPREILSEDEELEPEEDERRPRKERRRRRRRRKPGLIEEVYGHQVWGSIEREDKAEWAVVSSAVVAGGTRAVRSLADAVATEVARAAMMRRSRRPFGDQAAVNYVVRRNANVLGRKVVEQMVFIDGTGGARVVTRGTLPESGGIKAELGGVVSETGGTARYDVLVVSGGGDLEDVARRLAEDLCSSPRERAVYSDCQHRDRDQA